MKKLGIILQSNVFCVAIICFALLYVFVSVKIKQYKSYYDGNETQFSAVIKNISSDGDQVKLLIKAEEFIPARYYFSSMEEKEEFLANYHIGDYVKIIGVLERPNNNTNPNLFNYKQYLYRNKQFFILKIDSISKVSNTKNFIYILKNAIVNRISSIEKSSAYLNTFILSNSNDIDESVRNNYQAIGVSHLLSMAGMHISIFSMILFVVLKEKERLIRMMLMIISVIVLLLMDFSPSAMRTVAFFILLGINNVLDLSITSFKLLILSICIILFINPFIIYNVGFLYSAIVSIFLINYSNIINRYDNYWSQLFMTSVISFIAGLPITIYNFYELNFFSIFNNLLFVPIISFLVFPLSLLVLILPFLDEILYFTIIIIENLAALLSSFSISWIFIKLNLFFYLGYYLLIYLAFKRKIFFIVLLICLTIHANYNLIFKSSYMLMIDVGQGDAILFHSNNVTLLVDTGGSITYEKEDWQIRNHNYSIARDTLIPLFKSLGINKIDYLVLTHGDMDHAGETVNLIKSFKVLEIVFNNNNINALERNIAKTFHSKSIAMINKSYIVGEFLFKVYAYDLDNENDSSIILVSSIRNYNILLMGDASIKTEEYFLRDYKNGSVDIIKIGHHGSKTSTSDALLDKLKPNIALISAGRNNRFKHPNSEVMSKLEDNNITTFVTKDKGAIMIRYDKFVTLSLYPP